MFTCVARGVVAVQLQMNRKNFTGMLTELRIAEQIDPEFCDLQHELGLYHLAVRRLVACL